MTSNPPLAPVPDISTALTQRKSAFLLGRVEAFPRNQPIASDLAPGSCLRRQVLEVVAWKYRPPLDEQAIERMRAGQEAERRGLALLAELGDVQVVQQQAPFELKHHKTGQKVVGGKVDGILVVPEQPRAVLEIKLVSPWMFNDVSKAEDFLEAGWWTRKFLAQIHLYMVGLNLSWGVFMISDGKRWKFLPPLALDLEAAEASWALAEAAVEALDRYREEERAGRQSLPDYTKDSAQCVRCPFFKRTCNPPLEEEGVRFVMNDDDEADLKRWWELRPAKKEYDALDKNLKARIKATIGPVAPGETKLIVVGDFPIEVTGRAGYPVAARVQAPTSVVEISRLGAQEER